MEQTDTDRKALEDFVVGNAELEKLEAMLDRFNIFEAIGMVSQEVRHSRFLAFLLDPKQPHGLGDAFLKRFLQSAVSGSDAAVVTPIELSLWNLDGTGVQREWNHLDIFLLDDENRLAAIVENKIGSKEHSGQLQRYYELVREQYPEYRILAIYLTPNGDEPSHAEYLTLDYGTVCEMLDEVRKSKSSVMEPDAAVLVRHYTDMMRRHIVGDSEVARLAQQIYQKHQRAIDLIIENRFAQQEAISKVLVKLVKTNPSLRYEGGWADYPRQEFINFAVEDWDVPALRTAKGWSKSNLILQFCWCNWANSVGLMLQVGPGDEKVRQLLLGMSRNNQTLFDQNPGEWGEGRWINILPLTILSSEFYEKSNSEREDEIRRNWNDFLENDLPRIDAALRAEEWIWEEAPEPAPE